MSSIVPSHTSSSAHRYLTAGWLIPTITIAAYLIGLALTGGWDGYATAELNSRGAIYMVVGAFACMLAVLVGIGFLIASMIARFRPVEEHSSLSE